MTDKQRQPYRSELRILREGQPTAEQFPLTHHIGPERTVGAIELSCPSCDHKIPGERTRWEVRQSTHGDLKIRGVGVCGRCYVGTNFRARWRYDGVFLVLRNNQWVVWDLFDDRNLPWWDLWNRLARLLIQVQKKYLNEHG